MKITKCPTCKQVAPVKDGFKKELPENCWTENYMRQVIRWQRANNDELKAKIKRLEKGILDDWPYAVL